MSNIEKFHLIAGIIGFIVDIAALVSLGAALVSLPEGQPEPSLSPTVAILLIFVTIYGWLTLCWFLVRLYYLRHPDESSRKRSLQGVVNAVIFGTAAVSAPIWLPLYIWFVLSVLRTEQFLLFLASTSGFMLALLLIYFIIRESLLALLPIFYSKID